MEFVDRELTCVECNKTFVFSAAEQQFLRDKGFSHDPKRCKPCKARYQAPRGVKVETHAKCFECGIETIVPFKPTGKRPVLCASCFKEARNRPQTGILPVESADQAG